MTTATARYLDEEQIAAYQRDGYLAIPSLIDRERIEVLRESPPRSWSARGAWPRAMTSSTSIPAIRQRQPLLRRIKNPADHDPRYCWVAFESPIVDIVAELIGPAVRFHHSKLNLKGSRIGAPVEVHQDAAFYPHLQRRRPRRRPAPRRCDRGERRPRRAAGEPPRPDLQPLRRAGPLRRLHGSLGYRAPGSPARAELLALPAGSIHIHHYRLVHWSAPNTSASERRLLINSYSAADAVSLVADMTKSALVGRLLCGTKPGVVRRTAGEMPMPPDFSKGYTSIYELQTHASEASR